MEAQGIVDNFRNIVTQHYFDFEGRARRASFWYFVLAYFIIAIVLAIIQAVLRMGPVLTGLLSLAMLLPNLGVAVRRLHDTDRSGWWILIGFIPIVGWIIVIYWYCLAGTSGPNKFGADPKAAVAAA